MAATRHARWGIAALLLTAGAAVAETPSVKLLIGAGEQEARIRLGAPDIARREAGGAMWTYTRSGCALFVFFKASGREGLRVVGANAGPRRRGEAAPAVETCLAEVAAAKRPLAVGIRQ
jgi:hypothetical protein